MSSSGPHFQIMMCTRGSPKEGHQDKQWAREHHCEERLKELGIISLKKKRLGGVLHGIQVFKGLLQGGKRPSLCREPYEVVKELHVQTGKVSSQIFTEILQRNFLYKEIFAERIIIYRKPP